MKQYRLLGSRKIIFEKLRLMDGRYITTKDLAFYGNIKLTAVQKAIARIKFICGHDYKIEQKYGKGYCMTKIVHCCPHCGGELE